MQERYEPKDIEAKWQQYWDNNSIYKVAEDPSKPKYYCLDMFPYPSGAGLHVGHPRGYVASDVFSRAKRMQGFNVLHPMGFDSFGLPAEQYAISTGNNPGPFTEELIVRFREQLQMIGMSYDWSREVATHRPDFYKWTQWIFLKLFEYYYDTVADKALPITNLVETFQVAGSASVSAVQTAHTPFSSDEWIAMSDLEQQSILMNYRIAYEGHAEVNWCPEMGTVLANDEVVIDGEGRMVSERGGFPVERKSMRQWFMRITAYADRLISGLDGLDWDEGVKAIQRNWIGRSEGAEIIFDIANSDSKITVFTTRADTLFGVTYVVLAPEHKLVSELLSLVSNREEVDSYIDYVRNRSEDDRIAAREKTGVYLEGVFAINPANNEQVPVWIADYVLASYGTGAVMAVPAHDERDWEFAQKYTLPSVCVISPDGINEDPELPYLGEGFVFNSDVFSQLPTDRARSEIASKNKPVIKYKMRDAIFARQRYWGEPIPLRYDSDGMIHALADSELPLVLPNLDQYLPTAEGEPPLARDSAWLTAGYETNTMLGWAGSSWYWLRYMDPHNDSELASADAIKYWNNVDMYVGGREHATGHLLYSRFWNQFLFDIGIAPTSEPFQAMRNQGMILASDGRKMSKRWGNTVTPDEMVERFGADTFRLYQCFIGPFDASQPWIIDGLVGCRRFLERVWRIVYKAHSTHSETSVVAIKSLHKTIKKVGEDVVDFKFNTAVAAMMECINVLDREDVSVTDARSLLIMLAPFAPHMAEELYQQLPDSQQSVNLESWPIYNPEYLIDATVMIAFSVNGKPRGELEIPRDASQSDVESLAGQTETYTRWIADATPKKIIFVPNKIINFIL